MGTMSVNFWYTFTAATTLVFGAAYTLWMYKRVVFGGVANDKVASLSDIDRREFFVLGVLAIAVLCIGIYPKPLTDVLNMSVAGLLEYVAVSKL